MGKQLPSYPKLIKDPFLILPPSKPKWKARKYRDDSEEEEKKMPSHSAQDHLTTTRTNFLMMSSGEETSN